MRQSDKYLKEWSETIENAKDMLKNNNFQAYNALMEQANNIFEDYKRDSDLTYICKNFGMANYIFEDALPTLIKKDKKAVKEFITTIKEDKNLSAQFNFYNALRNYTNDIDAKEYVKESIEILNKSVDKKTIAESNKKLGKIITEHDIKPSDEISEDYKKLFEACNYVSKHDKKLSNLNMHTISTNVIVEHIAKNGKDRKSEKEESFESVVESFNKKYLPLLNEEEKSFVQEIMDAKHGSDKSKKEGLFNNLKNECIKCVNNLLKEASEDEKIALNGVLEQINNKTFSESTLVEDIAKMLEIRDVLLSDK